MNGRVGTDGEIALCTAEKDSDPGLYCTIVYFDIA